MELGGAFDGVVVGVGACVEGGLGDRLGGVEGGGVGGDEDGEASFVAVDQPHLFEGRECRELFGLFLGGGPAARVAVFADLDADLEALGVVGALFVEEDIARCGAEGCLGVLLEDAFEVGLVSGGGGGGDIVLEVGDDELACAVDAGVEVEGADDGLEDGGGEGGGEVVGGLHPLAELEGVVEAELDGDLGADLSGDDCGFDFGELAFEECGEDLVEVFADEESEDGVAEELEAFVGGEP